MRAYAPLGAALTATLLLAGAGPAAAEGYRLGGEEIAGAASIAQAPALEPGLYRDEMPGGGPEEGVRLYRVEVPEGARLHASATMVPPGPDVLEEGGTGYLGLSAQVLDADGAICDEVEGTGGDTSWGLQPLVAFTSTGPAGAEDGCPAGPLFVQVVRTGTMHAERALPLELRIAVEPEGTDAGAPAPARAAATDTGPAPSAPQGEEITPVGDGFSTAVPLAPGSYRLRLEPDRTGYVAVDAGQGQRLRWRAEVVSAEHGDTSRRLQVQAWNALRMPVPLAEDSDESVSATPGEVLGAGFAAPISLRNRESEETDVAKVWMPGRQYLSLAQLAPVEVDEATGAPVEPSGSIDVILTLEVEGEAVDEPGARSLAGRVAALPWGRIAAGAGALAAALLGAGLLGAALVRRRR